MAGSEKLTKSLGNEISPGFFLMPEEQYIQPTLNMPALLKEIQQIRMRSDYEVLFRYLLRRISAIKHKMVAQGKDDSQAPSPPA